LNLYVVRSRQAVDACVPYSTFYIIGISRLYQAVFRFVSPRPLFVLSTKLTIFKRGLSLLSPCFSADGRAFVSLLSGAT